MKDKDSMDDVEASDGLRGGQGPWREGNGFGPVLKGGPAGGGS